MIKGNDNAINLAKTAKPGDPSVLVSLEALEDLPEVYDGQVTQVTFVPPKDDKNPGDFAPVGGGKYMPSSDLVNRIAEARGISGMDMSITEPVYEDIDWNIMTRNDNEPPKLVRYLVGYRCTKQGKVLSPDGTERVSDPCTVIYNAWERVCELFAKEEMYTEGYTQPAKYGYKYNTMLKRRNAFASEMKFAERKADTKARNVVIRTVCGMPTGYDVEQLKNGYFIIGRVTRSSWAIKSEHAARLQAMARGVGDHTASKALFGPAAKTEPAPPEETPAENETEYTVATEESLADQALAENTQSEKPVTKEVMIKALTQYQESKLIKPEMEKTVKGLLDWLGSTKEAEKNEQYWQMALSRLAAIEENIPEAFRVR
jgi:hypothetical protein